MSMVPKDQTTVLICLTGLGLLAAYRYVRNRQQSVIHRLPGPKRESFLYGNSLELFTSQVGEAELKWLNAHGPVLKLGAMFGSTYLLISDPKAIQYMFHTSAYHFPKPDESRLMAGLINGDGILVVEGEDHKRHRKIMLPGFSAPEMKAFVPIFTHYASTLCSLWNDKLTASGSNSVVVDVPSDMSRATLDGIGEAAFNYQFNSLNNASNRLASAYMNFLFDFVGRITKEAVLFMGIMSMIPYPILQYFANRNFNFRDSNRLGATSDPEQGSSKGTGSGDTPAQGRLAKAKENMLVTIDVAWELIKQKEEELKSGVGRKDVLSLLVKANASEKTESKMTEWELLSQMRTLLFAGHETTSTTLTWYLLQLSHRPDIQTRLRNEIRERLVHRAGSDSITARDLEGMEYLGAVTKEVLRLYPAVSNLTRVSREDCVIPLQRPVELKDASGKVCGVINELPVKKGQKIIASITGYNHNKEVFGEDADEFNPDRWFRPELSTKVGLGLGTFSGLFTFSGGVRGCIGWRFAIYEVESFIIQLLSHFEFTLTEEAKRVRKEYCGVMSPTIEGSVEKGVSLPLKISVPAE